MNANPRQQIFTPIGGMNQDDSAITPTPNTAGRNAFGLGDYKYALNARIGSSKSDNFGDLETIKDTVEKINYFVRANIFNNSDFALGLTGWSQIVSGGVVWTAFGASVFALIVGSQVTDIIYQAVVPSQSRVGVNLKIRCSATVTNASAQIVFLNGTTVLGSQTVVVDASDVTGAVRDYSKYISVDLPSGCNRVGLRVYATSTAASITILEFKVFDWIAGSKPSGTERTIGKYENKEFNLLFYHVYNASGNHCLRFYNPVTEGIYELIRWSGLSFTSKLFVSTAMIDNFMAITDRTNSPRLIDIYVTPDLFLMLGAEFREYHLSFHRWAPIMPPVLKAYYDNVTNNYTKFEGKTLQYSYRYIFIDNTRSRWSPVSTAGQNFLVGSGNEITYVELKIPGFTLDVPGAATQYNYFNNDNVKFTTYVKNIEIGYRESAEDIWRIFRRYEVKMANNTSIYFDGNVNSTPIPTADFTQLFDTIPFKAGCVESIDNRFVFADILEENEAAMSPQITDVSYVKSAVPLANATWWNAGARDPADNATIYTGMSAGDADEIGQRVRISDTTFKGRGIYKGGIQWLAANGWRSAVYTIDTWMWEILAEVGITDKLYALTFKFPTSFRPPEWAVAYQIMRTNCLNIDYFIFGAANTFQFLYDNNAAYTDNTEAPATLRDRIRQNFENAHLQVGLDIDKYPIAAKYKKLHRSLVSDVRRTTVTATLADASRLYIDVNNWYNASKTSVSTADNLMNKLFYNYREGDRVRFVGSTNAAPIDAQKSVYDVLILEFTGRGIIVEKPSGVLWLPGNNAQTDPSDLLIEAYTPKIPGQADYVYYESGEWYPVLYPGTDQRDFSKRDWTYTNNAAMTCTTYGDFKVFNKRPFSYGDCHGISRTFHTDFKATPGFSNVAVATSSMNPDPSESYDFWEKCDGRPAPAYTDLPVVKFKTTQVRFGGQIIEESFVNQLTRFRGEDQNIYPSEYGRIRALVNTANAQVESVGAILLAIGERESFSIYVNRQTLEDLSGRTTVTLADKVLGSYNTLLGSHGTFNPESVSLDRGRVYFWDAMDGSWVRYGRDGLTEISFYKMRNWFRELGQLLVDEYNTSENPVVISEFDAYNEELVTFINHSVLPSTFRDYSIYKGALFSEDDKRWKSCHGWQPEMLARIKNQLVSFKDGKIYLHEQGSAYNTFYGSKQDVMIEPVFNELPQDMKAFQTLGLIATHPWSANRILSEYRGTRTKRQTSIALATMSDGFAEDAYYADIPMDQNSNVSNPMIEGDKMRSRSIRTLWKLDPSVVSLSLLHYVIGGEINSPKNQG